MSPVRPQTSRSRTIQGSSGRAAGAHRPCLPAAQEGQTKSLPGTAGGGLELFQGCRPTLLFALLILPASVCLNTAHAEIEVAAPQTQSKTVTQLPLGEINPCLSADNTGMPAMLTIPPGLFNMGSPDTEKGRAADEGPQHPVTIPRPFALSRCEITVGQFRQFIQESEYKTTVETEDKGCYLYDPDIKDFKQKPIKFSP